MRVEALEEVHPPLAELAAALSRPGAPVYLNAYAAWGISMGLALHYEGYAKPSLKKCRPIAARNEDKKVFSGRL